MKTKIYILTLFLTLPLLSFSQSNYYYYDNQKVYINIDREYVSLNSISDFNFLTDYSANYISKTEFVENNDRSYVTPTDNNAQSRVNLKNYYSEIKVKNNVSNNILNYTNFINSLNQNSNTIKVSPCFKTLSGKRLGLTNNFYVKVNSSSNVDALYNYAQINNLEVIGKDPYMSNWYILSCSKINSKNSLEYANQFHESGLFITAEPEFVYHDLQTTNDPHYNNQWGLKNTGQYGSAYTGIDINAEQVWSVTKGDNVKVAIYDHGFEMNHPDLASNVFGNGFDATTGTSPSQVRGIHGTACAGIIGAIQDNNIGVSGVAPESDIISISINLQFSDTPAALASGFNWAWQNGVEIISNSWGGYAPSTIITDAIYNAINNGRNGLGCIIVFASGNENNTNIRYPGSAVPEVLVVGAMSPCGERKSPSSCDGESWGGCYGNQLDIVAPGVKIPTTDRQGGSGYSSNDYHLTFNGTSSACPHVAGVAALILSVNQCLSAQQVRDIIEQTAQKVGGYSYTTSSSHPNGTWNNEMGYGLIDAYAAVQMAQGMGSTTLDLYVKDSPDDDGTEPNTVTEHMWTSQDIWIRNSNDNGLTHQNPEYRANGNPNYINVRVINKSCIPSFGNETLSINWAKANTALSWPQNWDGSLQNSLGFDLGDELSSISIPIIPAGGEAIVKIPWVVPNPDNYSDNDNPWHFCLLSRINATDDPLTSPLTSNPNVMVRNNNNLAWKNLTVVDLESEFTSGSVMVANPHNIPKTYFLVLQKETNEGGKAIFDEAEVTLKMDDIIFNAWERGGKQAELLEDKSDEKRKLVKGDNVILDNIMFEPNERGLLTLDFNFLTKELTDKVEYKYHVIQKDAITGEVIGGETFLIKKKSRPIFIADAGNDKEIDKNEIITISAEQINEAAIYNWYDTDGNLIYQGKDLTVSADITKKYKLEIIAETDGFKDYDEIEVILKPSIIENLSPNPTSNEIQVNYKLNGVNSAYLMIIGQYGTNGASNNYVLDVETSQTTINVANYVNGFYTVALVCNGQIVDAKTLIKQ
jgi:subtilisin family serine protease